VVVMVLGTSDRGTSDKALARRPIALTIPRPVGARGLRRRDHATRNCQCANDSTQAGERQPPRRRAVPRRNAQQLDGGGGPVQIVELPVVTLTGAGECTRHLAILQRKYLRGGGSVVRLVNAAEGYARRYERRAPYATVPLRQPDPADALWLEPARPNGPARPARLARAGSPPRGANARRYVSGSCRVG
jgi:hypothetical protein